MDISAACVAEYNLRVLNQGLEPEDMRAVACPLTGTPEELEGAQFDVVVVSYTVPLLSLFLMLTGARVILVFNGFPPPFIARRDHGTFNSSPQAWRCASSS